MRISVALCTYNGERFLPGQLESLAKQDRQPHEVVACDDGSDDGTIDVLESFAERSTFPIRIHRNAERLGTTKNFEQAIRLCAGDAVALCDQDDVWLPEKLDRLAGLMDDDPGIGFAFSDAELIDAGGRLLGRRLWQVVGFTPGSPGHLEGDLPLPLLVRRRVVTGATMVFRSRLREVVCPIPESWRHDAWSALVCAFASGGRMIADPLIHYRIHAGQQIGISRVVPEHVGREGHPDDPARPAGDRRRRYRLVAERFEQLVERVRVLEGNRNGTPDGHSRIEALREAAELARHHRLRADLPGSRLRRIPIVLRELTRGGYGRLSRGTLSAAKDIVY